MTKVDYTIRIFLLGTFSFLFSILSGIDVYSQSGNYYVSHYTSENGLPQNSIKGIETDKKGYLWLATEVGLVRYDGRRFRLYNQINPLELNKTRIIRIGTLKDSSLFVEGSGGDFYQITESEIIVPFSPDRESKKIIDVSSGFRADDLYDTCALRVIKNKMPEWILPDLPGMNPSLHNSLRYLKGKYFYFNKNRELISTDIQFQQFTKIKITGALADVLKRTGIHSSSLTLLTSNDRLYVRLGAWIYSLDISGKSEMVHSNRILEVENIGYIPFFREWPEHNLFLVGTIADGLYIFKKQFFSTLQFDNAEKNVFYAQAPFGKDGVLTKEGLLFPEKSIQTKVEGIYAVSIIKTADGHYFLNKWKNKNEAGIIELSEQLEPVRFFAEYNLRVRCFRQLNDGKLWFSGEEHFLGKIDGQKLRFINRPAKLPAGFIISTFIQTKTNELWIGGFSGLAKIDSSGKLLRNIPKLANVNIRCLYEDRNGIIWVGCYGGGFYALSNDSIISFPLDKNKYLTDAHSFLEDDNGYLWITTNRGLFQVSLNDLYQYIKKPVASPYYHYYEQSDGFVTNEFNGGCNPSGIKLNNGKFSFPSLKSLVQFYPDSVKYLLPNGAIYFDAILADTTHIDPTSSALNLSKTINRLQFQVSSPYFGNAYNQQIEYQLQGLDSAWYPVHDDGIIMFNKLASGKYKLSIRKKSGFGINSEIVNQLPFKIEPAFYETWIFKGLMGALLLALSYALYRLRIRLLLKQKSFLETEVDDRTKEQKLLIDSLENTVTELENSQEQLYHSKLFKERLAMIIMHDLQSPLRFLYEATRRVHEKSSQKNYSELDEISLELFKATGEIYNFVNDFGWWLNTMGKDFKSQKEKIDIPQLLQELNQFFAEQTKAQNNRIIFSLDSMQYINSDRQLLKIILRNIIDNANKYALNSTIKIKTSLSNGYGIIEISDNGTGIESGLLSKLRARLKEKSEDYIENQTGFGFRFIADLSKLLEIEVELKSEKDTGTVVTISNLKIYN